MPDYRNTKIYALRSHQTNKVYVGHTVQKLSKRFYEHKRRRNNDVKTTSHLILQYDDCYIELLEKFPCDDADEARRQEGEWIRKLDCVNRCVAGRLSCDSKKEYYLKNHQSTLEYAKKYRDEHQDKIKAYRKQYYSTKVICQCGVEIHKACINRHRKRTQHKLWQLNAHNIFNHL